MNSFFKNKPSQIFLGALIYSLRFTWHVHVFISELLIWIHLPDWKIALVKIHCCCSFKDKYYPLEIKTRVYKSYSEALRTPRVESTNPNDYKPSPRYILCYLLKVIDFWRYVQFIHSSCLERYTYNWKGVKHERETCSYITYIIETFYWFRCVYHGPSIIVH